MEAALLAHYGRHPSELSTRQVKVLTERLPPGAWPDPDHAASWSNEAHLLALLIDAVQMNTWVTANRGLQRHEWTERPKPLPRPGDGQQIGARSPTAMVSDMARALGLGG